MEGVIIVYNLLLIGAGGYAKSVLDSVDPYNYNMVGFVDEFNKDKMHLGYPIIASSLDTIPNADEFVYFIAIGNNAKRKIWYDRLVERNLSIINGRSYCNHISTCKNWNRLFCRQDGDY